MGICDYCHKHRGRRTYFGRLCQSCSKQERICAYCAKERNPVSFDKGNAEVCEYCLQIVHKKCSQFDDDGKPECLKCKDWRKCVTCGKTDRRKLMIRCLDCFQYTHMKCLSYQVGPGVIEKVAKGNQLIMDRFNVWKNREQRNLDFLEKDLSDNSFERSDHLSKISWQDLLKESQGFRLCDSSVLRLCGWYREDDWIFGNVWKFARDCEDVMRFKFEDDMILVKESSS